MGVVELHFPSDALGRVVTYSAIVPDRGEGPFSVLYQLHGASDDHRAWIERGNLVRHVDGMPLIVVLPDGALSYWANVHPLMRYEDFLVEDLAQHVRRTFRVRDEPAAIGGLSMGGYGALRLALRHPGRFASVAAHSSRIPLREELATLPWSRGVDPDELDLLALADRIDPATVPKLHLDCGLDDHRLEDSRRLVAILARRGVAHHYREHPGAHDWPYWDAHVGEALAHHARALRL